MATKVFILHVFFDEYVTIIGINDLCETVSLKLEGFRPLLLLEPADPDKVIDFFEDQQRNASIAEMLPLYGYGERKTIVEVECRSERDFFSLKRQIENTKEKMDIFGEIHDSITPQQQLFARTHVSPSTWVSVQGRHGVHSATRCKIQLFAHISDLQPIAALPCIPIVCDFDIEADNCASGKFPDWKLGDRIRQISLSFSGACFYLLSIDKFPTSYWESETNEERRKILNRTNFIFCNDEKDLILKMGELFSKHEAFFLSAYNAFGFDLPFLFGRAEKLGCATELMNLLSKDRNARKSFCHCQKQTTFGTVDTINVEIAGLICIDPLDYIRKDVGLGSSLTNLSLDAVAQHFNIPGKTDMSIKLLHQVFRNEGEPSWIQERLADIARYCIVDTEVLKQIREKICLVPSVLAESETRKTLLQKFTTSGQQIKSINLIFSVCASESPQYYVDKRNVLKGLDWYQGATVVNPKQGFYGPRLSRTSPIDIVALLDFASLYPSIMQEYNLCYSTILLKDGALAKPEHFELSAQDVYQFNLDVGVVYVVKPHVREGVIPRILKRLLQARKNYKQHMKASQEALATAIKNGDEAAAKAAKWSVSHYDCRQASAKVSANSVYGMFGVREGMLPCHFLAQVITFMGRYYIDETRRLLHENWGEHNPLPSIHGARVVHVDDIYGDTDSVFAKMSIDVDPCETQEEEYFNAFRLAKHASEVFADEITSSLNSSGPGFGNMLLEFEAFVYPMLISDKKKKYMGVKYTDVSSDFNDFENYLKGRSSSTKGKPFSKGHSNVRRDTLPCVADMLNRIGKCIATKPPTNLEPIKVSILETLNSILSNFQPGKNICANQLCVNKLVKHESDYKDCADKLAQFAACKHLNAKIDANEIDANRIPPSERIDYVVLVGPGKKYENSVSLTWYNHRQNELDAMLFSPQKERLQASNTIDIFEIIQTLKKQFDGLIEPTGLKYHSFDALLSHYATQRERVLARQRGNSSLLSFGASKVESGCTINISDRPKKKVKGSLLAFQK